MQTSAMDPTTNAMLTRLLTKLDQSLNSQQPDSHGLPSKYERPKIASNIEHARTLLLTLETQSRTIRVQSQKQQTQADLQRKRDAIKRMNLRLQELREASRSEDEDDDDDDDDTDENSEEDEDGQGHVNDRRSAPSYAPARSDAQDGIDAFASQDLRISPAVQQELRARRPLQASDSHNQASASAREQLFTGRSQATTQGSSLANRETLLSHNRTEQEGLTNGLLSLAKSLKDSSQQFSMSLAEEKEVLKRAEGGLDQSALRMEAAERKMGTLRRLSEGQGWYGRLKLYGSIAGLWLACFLLVFAGPKLRF